MDRVLLHHQTAAPLLSTDDVLMGEILISLKRTAVQRSPTCTGHSASYRSKVDLTVQMPPPPPPPHDDASVSMAIALAMTSPQPLAGSSTSPVASAGAGAFAAPPSHSPSERTKRYGPVVQLDDLRSCFNMPIAAVARKFGICATLLKKICRRHGIQRWPHRQIRSLQKSIDMLRESLAVAKGSNQDYIAKKIAAFEYTLECIMLDPNTAAKGISAGRLASPETAKRGGGGASVGSSTSGDDAAAKSPSKKKNLLASSSALAAALSEDDDDEDEDEDDEMNGERPPLSSSSSSSSFAPMQVWSPPQEQHAEERSMSMSLKSILC
ncbi:hypothetical protein PybrP1_005645 [[Pythium] brassicae (nom. inval.)]|nr:hypothetical protein PybrP1_005645 [[Pythium] brassicae (nom. inval.)]